MDVKGSHTQTTTFKPERARAFFPNPEKNASRKPQSPRSACVDEHFSTVVGNKIAPLCGSSDHKPPSPRDNDVVDFCGHHRKQSPRRFGYFPWPRPETIFAPFVALAALVIIVLGGRGSRGGLTPQTKNETARFCFRQP